MSRRARRGAVAVAAALFLILGVTLWVGMRVGQAALTDAAVGDAGGASLLGERRLGPRLADGHGAVGSVTLVAPPRIELVGREGQQRTILVTSDTLVAIGDRSAVAAPLEAGDISSIAELKPGVRLVVIGQPDEAGQLIARIIRIVPKTESDHMNSEQPRSPSERKGKTTP